MDRTALERMLEQIRVLSLGLAVGTAFEGLRASDHNTYFSPDQQRIGLGAEFEAPFDGRLMALANDFESGVPLMDRYGNNEGWVVVGVTRMA